MSLNVEAPDFLLDFDQGRFNRCHRKVVTDLLAERTRSGHWEGHLSSSALSTATAITALALLDRHTPDPKLRTIRLQQAGLKWLNDHVNEDGGWGDTTISFSNISTTALVWAAFGAVKGALESYPDLMRNAEAWLRAHSASLSRDDLSEAITKRYGKDKTFSVPILTMCALSGRFGKGKSAWQTVGQLPFELAAFPPNWYAAMKLPVVSYALPALIAIGQVRHHFKPTWNPITRLFRRLTRKITLTRLLEIQPSSGGFLEATPLTSFVVMSLAGCRLHDHPVAKAGKAFLEISMRKDGSWPIDTNLATWVTSLSVHGLGKRGLKTVPEKEQKAIESWLLNQQFQILHPYTQASPGGWAWTDLPGGVPDADDTPGALIALHRLSQHPDSIADRAWMGVRWLMDLQNRDGGIPTFCKGWGALPFDRSSADLTAHTLRAWVIWKPHFEDSRQQRVEKATDRAVAYLLDQQSSEGSWVPLWFGNQYVPDDQNPVYGTTKVMEGLLALDRKRIDTCNTAIENALQWLLSQQNKDGGWGGGLNTPSSVEETALGISVVAKSLRCACRLKDDLKLSSQAALRRSCEWLFERIASGTYKKVSPIGFYFAKLWYWESMYPLVYTGAALNEIDQWVEQLTLTHSSEPG
ncbi:MAG: squalene--hopene cyclase [Verrucomicrobia bacterium]|nr:squalene--hopene cyclase [Verrucomicrobiota bacterium]